MKISEGSHEWQEKIIIMLKNKEKRKERKLFV
jgi:hypothetical protein